MSTLCVHSPSPPVTLPPLPLFSSSLLLTLSLFLSLLSSSIPSSDALSNQLHIESACSVHLPHSIRRHPGAEPLPPPLFFPPFRSPLYRTASGRWRDRCPAPGDETRAKALKCPLKLLNILIHNRKLSLSFFLLSCVRSDQLFVNAVNAISSILLFVKEKLWKFVGIIVIRENQSLIIIESRSPKKTTK